jgi:hypothetical protein
MSSREVGLALGAAAGAVLGTAFVISPVAYADNLYDVLFPPPNATFVPPATNVENFDIPLFGSNLFSYHQADKHFNVTDFENLGNGQFSDNVVGHFDAAQKTVTAPGPFPFVPFFHSEQDVVSDSTGMAPADGTTYDMFAISYPIPTLTTFGLFGNYYVSGPAGTADDLILFGGAYPIIDTLPDSTSAASGIPAAAGSLGSEPSDLLTALSPDFADAAWPTDFSTPL